MAFVPDGVTPGRKGWYERRVSKVQHDTNKRAFVWKLKTGDGAETVTHGWVNALDRPVPQSPFCEMGMIHVLPPYMARENLKGDTVGENEL